MGTESKEACSGAAGRISIIVAILVGDFVALLFSKIFELQGFDVFRFQVCLAIIWAIGFAQLMNFALLIGFGEGFLKRFAMAIWYAIQGFGVLGICILIVGGLNEDSRSVESSQEIQSFLLVLVLGQITYWYGTYRLLRSSIPKK